MLEDLKLGPLYEGFLFLAETVRNPSTLRPHHHVELELNLVVQGSITYVVGGQRFTFQKRSLLWLFPDQEHQLIDRSKDAEYFVAVFKPDLIRRACKGERYAALREARLSDQGVLHSELPVSDFDLLRRTMESIVADGMDPDLLNREAGFGLSEGFSFQHRDPDWLNAGLRHLLLLSWRQQQGPLETARQIDLHPAVRKALQWINDREEQADPADLYRFCGVSESYLSRLFHRQIGVTLTRYRNSVRLSRFWAAYRRPQSESVLEAAYAGGFGSYAQFFRVFREAYGVGPRQALARLA